MIVGKSAIINSIRQTITKVSQTNSRVLILGSSGSGKEACARTIHQESLEEIQVLFMLIVQW